MGDTRGTISTGLACLLQCSLMKDTILVGGQDNALNVCERRCNARYMTLDPVTWQIGKEFNVNNTIFVGLEGY